MRKNPRETASLATLEACNALKAETFRKLPQEIELWRFREVLLRLRRYLRLSDGAVTYALDLMGLLTEADWRGDGRPVTFHSVRGYARKVDKCERTIGKYEAQLIEAGLVHRTVKHARRHGGHGNAERRTGLDWRAFGVEMPDLLKRLEERNAHDERCFNLETRIRSERRIILGLAEAAGEGRALHIEAELSAIGISPLRACLCVEELEPILTSLILLRSDLADCVEGAPDAAAGGDNTVFHAQESEQSESLYGLIDTTIYPSSPTEKRICLRINSSSDQQPDTTEAIARSKHRTVERESSVDAIPLPEIWHAAPNGWKSALGEEVDISWPVLIELANHLAPSLGVSPYAWNKAIRLLGPSEAALALLVLDRNRDHPARPVISVGGALVGMTRRAEQGDFNLAPSIYGIMSRKPRGVWGDHPVTG